MKKLYAGLAAAAMTATGIACTAGAAHATGTWPDQFAPSQIVATADGASFVLGSYDTGVQADDGAGGTYDVDGYAVVKVAGDTVTTINLGTNAHPTAIAAHGDTVYVVGSDDATYDSELWTVDGSSDDVTQHASPIGVPTSISVSPDGTSLGIASDDQAVVVPATGEQAAMPTTLGANSGHTYGAFSPDGSTYYVSGEDNTVNESTYLYDQTSVLLWSLPATGSGPATSLAVIPPSNPGDAGYDAYAGPVVVGADGTVYVATSNEDDAIRVVKDGAVQAGQTQAVNGNVDSLALSADGSALYTVHDGSVEAFTVDGLGSFDNEDDETSYAPTYAASVTADAVAINADDSLIVAERQYDYDETTGTSSIVGNAVDVVTTPGAPSNVTAERNDTWANLSFSPAASTGSSAWTSTDPESDSTFITYTVTLHNATDSSKSDVVDSGYGATSDIYLGDDENPLVPGDAYTVSVTTTNGLFTSAPATYDMPAYQAPSDGDNGGGDNGGGDNGGGTQPTPPAPPATQPVSQPVQVSQIKPAAIKASAKKVKLTLPGVSVASAPGKVKVYDGKKLVGTAKIVNGQLVVKLKKHLSHGKHKLKLNYQGSAQVAAFHKKVSLKVK